MKEKTKKHTKKEEMINKYQMYIYKDLYFTNDEFQYLCDDYGEKFVKECVEILAEDLKQGKIKKYLFREDRKYMHINKLRKLLKEKSLDVVNCKRKKLGLKPLKYLFL